MSDSLPVICNWQSPWSEKESCHCLPDNTYWFLPLHTNQTCHLISFLLNLSQCVGLQGSLIRTWNSYSNIPIPTIPTNERVGVKHGIKKVPSKLADRLMNSHVVKALKVFLHWRKKTRVILFHHLIFLLVCFELKKSYLISLFYLIVN